MKPYKIEFNTDSKKFTIDGRQLKNITSLSIDCNSWFNEVTIKADCNIDIKGILVPEDVIAVRCTKCGKLLCYSTNGEVEKIRCKSCNKVSNSKQLKLMKRLERRIEIRGCL